MQSIAYKPVARRPIAAAFRVTARAAVRACVRRGIHPDLISYASIAAAGLAALCFWQAGPRPVLLIVAPLLAYVRLWLNMLDGMVAVAAGRASRRGEIVNDLPDRVSDVIVFVGVAHSGLCTVLLGYWCAIAALLTAYVGTLAAAVGAERQFGGLMSKPWRMVALHLGAWTALGLRWSGADGGLAGLTALDWTLIVILVGCAQTVVLRLARTIRVLGDERRPT